MVKEKPIKKVKKLRHAPLGDQILAAEAPKVHRRIAKPSKEDVDDEVGVA